MRLKQTRVLEKEPIGRNKTGTSKHSTKKKKRPLPNTQKANGKTRGGRCRIKKVKGVDDPPPKTIKKSTQQRREKRRAVIWTAKREGGKNKYTFRGERWDCKKTRRGCGRGVGGEKGDAQYSGGFPSRERGWEPLDPAAGAKMGGAIQRGYTPKRSQNKRVFADV